MQSGQFICHFSVIVYICVQDYWESNQPISSKLGVMTGPASRKNWLTFDGDPVPDMDSRSLFLFCHHCRIVDFMIFVSISHRVNTLRSSALALCYSAAEYCAPVWSRSANTSQVDVQLNSTMRLISGTLRSTHLPWLPVLWLFPAHLCSILDTCQNV